MKTEKWIIMISPPFKQGPTYLPLSEYNSENGEVACVKGDEGILMFDTYKEAEEVAKFLTDEYSYQTGVLECPESLL